MVDRNGNGIPDDRERQYGVPGKAKSPYPAPSVNNYQKPQVQRAAPQQSNPLSGMGDMIGGLGKGIGTVLGAAVSPIARLGIHGTPSRASVGATGPKFNSSRRGAFTMDEEDTQKSFADYLNEAMSMLGGGGAGGGGGINYDPQRATLRGNASEADARLEAMYRQLRGSIDADAPVLQQAYGEAMDSTAGAAQKAQEQIQGASDAASSRNNEVLANLGIEQAQGNIIQEGRDLNTQTAGAIADSAGLGQAAGNRLTSNQATALQHNTNIGNAAGLEGNLQRAANQAKLQSLLAEIDMQEQSQNAQLQGQGGGNNLSDAMSLMQEMIGFDRYGQEREDELQMSAQELASKQKQALPNFDQMIQALAARGIAVPEDPSDLARLLDSSRRYSF